MLKSIYNSGIVLITTLLTVVLVVMMVTAVVQSGTSGLAMTTNFHDREVALLAAESGLQYAVSRLQQDISWIGVSPASDSTEGSSKTVSGANTDFAVVEDNGNVIGIITSKLGQKSMFRIKFNFEDYSGGEDEEGLKNPEAKHCIPSAFVSYNNLLGNVSIPAYRANNNGKGINHSSHSYNVPKGTACIIVEGIAGPGVRELSLSSKSLLPSGYTVTRLVEGYYQIDAGNETDSVAYAAGDLKANLANGGRFLFSSKVDDSNPRIRSMKSVDINANGGSLVAKSGTIYYGSSANDASNHCFFNNSTPDGIKTQAQNSSDQFKKLYWEDITKAAPEDTNLKSGTYEWRLVDGERVLMYFAQVYPLTVEIPADAKGTIVNTDTIADGDENIIVDPEAMGILINSNVYVPGDLVIRNSPELKEYRSTIGFVPAADGNLCSVLTSTGDISIQGGVMGSGSVTTEGSITFQGASLLESDPDTGVSMYAQKDVNLQAITQTVSGAKALVQYAAPTSKQAPSKNSSQKISSTDLQEKQDQVENVHNLMILGKKHGGGKNGGKGSRGSKGSKGSNDHYDVVNSGNGFFDFVSTTTTSEDSSYFYYSSTNVDNNSTPPAPTEISVTNVEQSTSYADTRLVKDVEGYSERKKAQLAQLIDTHSKITYADQDITGVIYTWGNLNVDIGEDSFLNLTGTVIAYGGDPSKGKPGTVTDSGNINISKAKNVNLSYDPTYIKELLSENASVKLKRTLWTSW